MLSHCSGSLVIQDPFRTMVGLNASTSKWESSWFGTVGGFEVAEGSSRFMLVRNNDTSIVGPRTIILRGGSGEVLAEAARGLKAAISVVKCALMGRKTISNDSAPTIESKAMNGLIPCSIGVLYGGGCVEMALAKKLRREIIHKSSSNDRIHHAVNVITKSLDGIFFNLFRSCNIVCWSFLYQDLLNSWQPIVV